MGKLGSRKFSLFKEKTKNVTRSDPFYIVFLVVLIIFLFLTFFFAICFGAVRDITLSETFRVFFGKIFFQPSWYSDLSLARVSIIWDLRVPRVLMGLICGSGLALCGAIMQATVNNPIAEPYILGVSAGATFGATLTITFGLTALTSLGSFFGAIIATIAVILIANHGGKLTSTRLILAGTVINALFTAFSNFIISVFANNDSISDIKFWTMGSLANVSFNTLLVPAIVVIAAIIFFLTQSRILNTMMMGDETAISLGINLSIYRFIYMVIVALLTGVLVASCGIIGFVGLVIPHIIRGIIGTNYKKVVPLTILLGAIFLTWSDVLARTIINAELPIGIFTALVGAPFFIYIVVKKNYGRE